MRGECQAEDHAEDQHHARLSPRPRRKEGESEPKGLGRPKPVLTWSEAVTVLGVAWQMCQLPPYCPGPPVAGGQGPAASLPPTGLHVQVPTVIYMHGRLRPRRLCPLSANSTCNFLLSMCSPAEHTLISSCRPARQAPSSNGLSASSTRRASTSPLRRSRTRSSA